MPRSDRPHPGLSFLAFVLTISSLQAMAALGTDSMLANLPAIGREFGLQHENARQLVITAYLAGFGLTQIPYGFMADRFGRKPVILAGIGVFVLFSVLAAFAPSFPLLVLARLMQGVGGAASRSLPASVVRDCYAGRQMARVMSLSFMVFMAVPMVAPTLGAGIALVASWRWVFGALALFSAGVGVWVFFKLPETLHEEDRTPIVPSRMAHSFLAALRSRTGMGYAAAMTFAQGALFGFVNSVQQIFQDVFKAPAVFPIAFAGMAGCMALASLANARLVGRVGMRRMSHWALAVYILVSGLHAAVALSGRETFLTFIVLQGAVMFCFGLMAGNFGAMAMEPLGHVAGAAASLQGTLVMLGGSAVGLAIGQSFNGTTAPLAIGFTGCGLAALACVLFAERGRLFHGHQPDLGAAAPADAH